MEKEILPTENETIAAKRAARISKKLAEARHKVFTPAWWSNGVSEIIFIILIFILNLFIIYPILGTSDKGTVFSGPIIPYLSQLIVIITQIPFPFAVQFVGVIFYLFFPLSFYMLIKSISGRKLAAILATLIISIPIYPFAKMRILAGFTSLDGPHVVSLGLIPLALYGLLLFLRYGGIKNLLIGAVLGSAIMLISPFGFLNFAVFATMLTLSEMMLGNGRLKLSRLALSTLTVGALTSFWYHPNFALWLLSGGLGEQIREAVGKLLPISLFTLPALGIFGFLLFDRKPSLQPVFLAIFWTIAFTIIILTGGSGFMPSNPSRYILEFGISLAFLLGISLQRLIDYLKLSSFLKVSWLVSPLVVDIIVVLVLIGLIIRTIVTSVPIFPESESLEIFTGVERGKIWIARENFDGISSIAGQGITLVAVVILTIFWTKSRVERSKLKISE